MIKKERSYSSLNRVIDANLNRLKEGVRVIEDIYRYVFNSKEIGYALKDIRHLIKVDDYFEVIKSRDSIGDVLKSNIDSEFKRDSIESIVIANFKRTQESARVLEEIYKLTNIESAKHFKEIRYRLYSIEKKGVEVLREKES